MRAPTNGEQRLFEIAILVVVFAIANVIAGESNLLTNVYCNTIDSERLFCAYRPLPRNLSLMIVLFSIGATFSWKYPRVRIALALGAMACALVLAYAFHPAARIHLIFAGP